MNCLNNETIQAFLDEELTPEQELEVQAHLKSCSLCETTVENYKKELLQIKALLKTDIPDSKDIIIPEFTAPKPRKSKQANRILMYATAAAVVTIMGISAFVKNQNQEQEKLQMLAMQEWEIMQQTSMNEQWQNRMVTITITDKEGNIVEQITATNN